MKKNAFKLFLYVGIVFIVSACFSKEKLSQEVDKMSGKIDEPPMKTVCIGRFLIDVPENSIVTYGKTGVTGWNIFTVADEDERSFNDRLEKKEKELLSAENQRGGISLEAIRKIKSKEVMGVIYIYNRVWAKIRNTNPQKYDEAVSIDALINLNNVTYYFKGDVHKIEEVSNLEGLIYKIASRDNSVVPKQAGFCFDRAIINEDLGIENHEFVVAFFGMKEYPDLAIALSSLAGTAGSKTLLERDAENLTKIEHRSRFHTLREGRRVLNNIAGEEILDHVHELNGSELQGFMWESFPSRTDVYQPRLTLEFDTGYGQPGEPVNSSLSDAKALALWEKISSSLRRRPVDSQASSRSNIPSM